LLAKLRIAKLRKERKNEKREKKGFDALSNKQEVLPTAKYDPDVVHRFP